MFVTQLNLPSSLNPCTRSRFSSASLHNLHPSPVLRLSSVSSSGSASFHYASNLPFYIQWASEIKKQGCAIMAEDHTRVIQVCTGER